MIFTHIGDPATTESQELLRGATADSTTGSSIQAEDPFQNLRQVYEAAPPHQQVSYVRVSCKLIVNDGLTGIQAATSHTTSSMVTEPRGILAIQNPPM